MISYFKKKIKKATNSSISNNNEAFNYFNQQVYFPRGSILYKRTIDEGIYEKENVNLITSLLKPGTTIFDIGANIGLMAIPVLSFDDSVQVISVEASPNTLPYLMKTQKSSQFSTRWKIIDKAVSDRVGLVNFHLADASNGAFESLQDTERVNFTHVKEIESTTIDLIWEENEKPEVSFIKIDIYIISNY